MEIEILRTISRQLLWIGIELAIIIGGIAAAFIIYAAKEGE